MTSIVVQLALYDNFNADVNDLIPLPHCHNYQIIKNPSFHFQLYGVHSSNAAMTTEQKEQLVDIVVQPSLPTSVHFPQDEFPTSKTDLELDSNSFSFVSI